MVVVKLSMEFNKGKATVITMRSIFYNMMLLFCSSVCFVLGLFLLGCLQPGEPLVDLE